MEENKQDICDALLVALKKTRYMKELESLTYDDGNEIVTAKFSNGGKKEINVSMDSGQAMIRDIMSQI